MINVPLDPELKPGTWCGGRTQVKRTAMVACPNCGRVASLTDHDIDAAGCVSPSVVCPFDCGFHDHIRLENWHAG